MAPDNIETPEALAVTFLEDLHDDDDHGVRQAAAIAIRMITKTDEEGKSCLDYR